MYQLKGKMWKNVEIGGGGKISFLILTNNVAIYFNAYD